MRLTAACLVLSIACAGCAPMWKAAPHDERFQAAPAPRLHRLPRTATLSDWWDKALHSTVVPLAKRLSPARYMDWLRGGRPALDINAFGQVPDSTWFENRISRGAMTPEDVARGPIGMGGIPGGPLTVVSGKLEGATPGVIVRDASGGIWFVKFDPPAFPELSTGAEVIASRILHAAGYHVPEVHVAPVAMTRFVLADDAYRRDRYNRRVPMTYDDLLRLLANTNPDIRGEVRALFSRSVPGRPIGPFTYRGVRPDDPNDRIPHERRRSLRGLWLIAAWINNTDPRGQNTLDTFISVPQGGGLGYLRHYLIDFGDALGAAGERIKYRGEGYEGQVAWDAIGLRSIALGILYPYWLPLRRDPYPAVGMFEAELFDPARWAPNFPNPAFDEATAEDSFWAASIVARFSRAHVEAAVSTAGYRSPEVVRKIAQVLMRRRDKVLRYVFGSMLALDDPVVVDGTRLMMTDLEVAAGLRGAARYRWSVRWNRTAGRDRRLITGSGELPSADVRRAIDSALRLDRDGFNDDPFLTVTFGREGHPAAVDVHVRVAGDRIVPVAVRRDVD